MDIEHLLLEHQLNQVLARYARACDQRDWAALDEVFVQEATADYGGSLHLQGRGPIVAMIRAHLGGCGPSQHLLGNLLVEARDGAVASRVYVRAAHRGTGDQAAGGCADQRAGGAVVEALRAVRIGDAGRGQQRGDQRGRDRSCRKLGFIGHLASP